MSNLPAFALPVGLELARLGLDAAQGKTPSLADVARRLMSLGLRLAPHEELVRYLTEAGREAAELVADADEKAKFARSGHE